MNRGQLLELHAKLTDDARKLIVVKNADYAGLDGDPFRNFRRWGLLGIIVRLSDKVSRLETFVIRGNLQVKSEQVRDSVIDIINYAVLFEGYNSEASDANGKGSNSGDSTGKNSAWTVPKGHDAELRAFVRGDWGGGPGGGGDHTFAPAQRAAAYASAKSARRTGAMRGGNKHVGGKHRRRTGKGKS